MDDRPETRSAGELDVRSLRYLLAVSRERSFTGAAASLDISQPALSQAIARLEQLVGGRLVVRDARGVAREGPALTLAGQSLAADAASVVEQLDRALVRARRTAAEGDRERLTVGIGTSTPRRVSTALVRAAGERPRLDIVLRHVPWGQELPSLNAGAVDVVFAHLADGQLPAGRVRVSEVAAVPRTAVFAVGHRLAGREGITMADIAREPILDAGSDRDVWLVDPRPTGPMPPVLGPAAQTVEEMLAVVASGRAMAITSDAVAEAHRSADLSFVPITDLAPLRLVLLALADDEREAVDLLLTAVSA